MDDRWWWSCHGTGADSARSTFACVGGNCRPAALPVAAFQRRFGEDATAYAAQPRADGHDGILILAGPTMAQRLGGEECGADTWIVFASGQRL